MVLPGNNTTHGDTARTDSNLDREDTKQSARALAYFPDRQLSADNLRTLLETGSPEDRLSVISDLLRFAPWDEIWLFVTRETVGEVLGELDLSESLRSAWEKALRRAAE